MRSSLCLKSKNRRCLQKPMQTSPNLPTKPSHGLRSLTVADTLCAMEGGPWFDGDDAQREASRTVTDSTEVSWVTPLNQVLQLSLPFTVYPPREDTDLLAAAMNRCSLPTGASVLDVGCGSGALSLFAAGKGWRVTGCDVNPLAVAAARGNAKRHGHRIIVHEGGPGPVADGLESQWGGDASYDLVVWNMPYLSPTATMASHHLGPLEEASMTDTSQSGLYDDFVHRLATTPLLNAGGLALVVVSSSGDQPGACAEAWRKGMAAQPVLRRVFDDGEVLEVLALWCPYHDSPRTHLATIDSTNTSLLEGGASVGHRLSADHQGAGHGRRGRRWVSSHDAVEASWLVEDGAKVHHRPLDQVRLGQALVSCCNRLSSSDKEAFLLKWPNDLYVSTVDGSWKKCGGILYEMRSQGSTHRVVVGIGINVAAPAGTPFAGVADGGVSTEPALLMNAVHAVVASLHEPVPHGAGPPVEVQADVAAACQRGLQVLGPLRLNGRAIENPRLLNSGEIVGMVGGAEVRLSDSDVVLWVGLQDRVHGG